MQNADRIIAMILYRDRLFMGTSKINKSDGKRQNTLGCLDQYVCNVLRLWNSLGT